MAQFFEIFMNYGRQRRAKDPTIDALVTEMERLRLEADRLPKVPEKQADEVAWDKSMGHCTEEQKTEVKRMCRDFPPLFRGKKCNSNPLDSDELGQTDVVLIMLMMRMLLLHPSDKKLDGADKVRRLHEHQAWQLHRYLKTNYGPAANSMLHQCFMLVEPFMAFFNILFGHKS